MLTTAPRSSTTNMASVSNNNSDKSNNNKRSSSSSSSSFPNNRVSRSRSGGSSSGVMEEQEQQHENQQQQEHKHKQQQQHVGDAADSGLVVASASTTTTGSIIRGVSGAETIGGGGAGFGSSTPPRGGDWKSPIMTHFGGGERRKRSTTIIQPTNDDEEEGEDVPTTLTTSQSAVDSKNKSSSSSSSTAARTAATQVQAAATDINDSIEAVLVEATKSPDSKSCSTSSNTRKNNGDILPQPPPEKEEEATPTSSSSSAAASAFPFSLSLSEDSDRATTPTRSTSKKAASIAPPITASALSAEYPTGAICDPPPPQRRERYDSLKLHQLEAESSEFLPTEAAQQIATHFAAEHKIFLKAALALLTERDRHAPTVGMMDPVVLKSGPLKKASHLMNGVWKVKYVEIRRGMFSYYENVAKEGTPGQLRRKNIPLDAGHVGYGSNSGGGGGGNNTGGGGGNSGGGGGGGVMSVNSDHNRGSAGGGAGTSSGNDHHAPCTCRAVRLHQKAFLKLTIPGQAGAMFELSVHGQKRLWMANSRAERAVWMQAIENAMVGGSVTGYSSTSSAGGDVFDHRGKIRHVSPRSPFRSDLRLYLRLQSYLRSIHTKTEYVDGLREVLNHPIKVPVKWIAKQALLSDQAEGNNAFLEQEVDLSVEQLWRDLQRDSVCIDGKVYRGDHPTQGPERILGALMRRILQTAAASSTTRTDWTQAQALSFARDILLSGNRTRSGGDSYFCINSLFKHPELVVVVPSGTEVEPVSITVSQDESDLPLNAKSGWIQTRSSKLQRSWKKFFFVLSEGMLTHYERAAPRPHGLRGQLAMTDASISVARRQRPNSSTATDIYFVISIVAKDGKERLLRFENEDRILDWTHALETMARAKGPNSKSATNSVPSASEPTGTAPATSTPASAARRLMPRRRTGGNSQDDANSNQNINNNNNTLAASTALASTTPGSTATSNLAEQVMEAHGRNLGISMDKVKDRLALRSRKTSSAVRVFIQAVTDYKICTTDPDGDEQLDTWGYVRTQFQQNFRLSGGPSGFISRGEEIVLVTVIDCVDLGVQGGEDTQQPFQQQQHQQSAIPSSPDEIPPSPARRQLRKTRIFRQFLDDPGAEDP